MPIVTFPWPVIRPPLEWIDQAIPVFSPRSEEERSKDRFDGNPSNVDIYTGLAYGYRLFGEGAAEGLYRTMSSLVLAQRQCERLLDIGCGVGRMLYDCAPALPHTQFTGVDYSYEMCRRAARILQSNGELRLPAWQHRGMSQAVLRGVGPLPNVHLAQANALDLPFAAATFDTVTATLLLCRLSDPLRGLAEMVRVLRPGGRLLLATPFGYLDAVQWQALAGPGKLREILSSFGFRIEEWFDGLVYREVIDASGNAHDWRVTVAAATLVP
ncbi:MAG: class I SAM-dependent methyltransferase [Bryobacteraceae bacterium]|nr:class I SAM-dependent methyltransferase [Bryobacteraceae bacterium]MDW8378663.1 class I SAM-dependent methyltransferase [Bryobacterales bacterium]